MRDKGGRGSKNPQNLRDVIYGWSPTARGILVLKFPLRIWLCKAENKGATCPFRLAQDGSMVTIPFLKKRIGRGLFTYEVHKIIHSFSDQ